MAGFKMDDYVDVAERIHQFYERFPEGSLRTGTCPFVMQIGDRPFVVYHAQAFRKPDDPCPTDGWAWEPVPGPTQFTRDSELMNAETAAWGRAIVALGFETKKIASSQEVRARSAPGTAEPDRRATAKEAATNGVAEPAAGTKFATEPQRKRLFAIAKKNDVDSERLREILAAVTGQESTAQIPAAKYDDVIKMIELEQVPFE